jgi:hypothetical protein
MTNVASIRTFLPIAFGSQTFLIGKPPGPLKNHGFASPPHDRFAIFVAIAIFPKTCAAVSDGSKALNNAGHCLSNTFFLIDIDVNLTESHEDPGSEGAQFGYSIR